MSKSVSKTRVACCARPLRWRRLRDPSSCHRKRLGGGVVALPQSWGELLDLLAEFLGFSMVSEEGGQAHKRLGLARNPISTDQGLGISPKDTTPGGDGGVLWENSAVRPSAPTLSPHQPDHVSCSWGPRAGAPARPLVQVLLVCHRRVCTVLALHHLLVRRFLIFVIVQDLAAHDARAFVARLAEPTNGRHGEHASDLLPPSGLTSSYRVNPAIDRSRSLL